MNAAVLTVRKAVASAARDKSIPAPAYPVQLKRDRSIPRPALVCRWHRDGDGRLVCLWQPLAPPDPPGRSAAVPSFALIIATPLSRHP
jgi:hypothetical protein